MAYSADRDTPGVLELCAVALSGGDAVKLSAPLVSGVDLQTFRFTFDGSRVFYLGDQHTDDVREVFSLAPEPPERPAEIFADGFE
ncbi:MAG: hypothetical protein KDI37_07385 [Xanthomonadales bacterium]|nr:hypothetical protein [Xanthomonadales bacterium]MCB1641539.1 hypothetical protein [Xanthomonadales bacterium]